MQFAIGSLGNISKIDYVKRAEDLGFSHFGIGDGPLLFSDPYACLALAARETSSINIGTFMTNPLTRIPAVTANAHATLSQLAPGRVFFGISAANNALRSMGVRIAKVEEIEDCIRVFKGLMSGERVENHWLGVDRDLQFLDPDGGWYDISDPIPVWQAVGGPKAMKVAAKYADYVVYCLGPDENLTRLVRDTLDREARAVGRDPSEIKLVGLTWWYNAQPGEGVAEAIANGFGNGPVVSGLTNINFLLEHREELGDRIVDFALDCTKTYVDVDGSGPVDHLDAYRTHLNGEISPKHVALMDEYVCDYFCVWGDEDRCRSQLQRMLDAGVDIPCVFLTNPSTYHRDLESISRIALRDGALSERTAAAGSGGA